MPRQLLHRGREFSLVPLRNDSHDERSNIEITEAAKASGDWSSHYYDASLRDSRTEGDGVVESQDPSVYLSWSKGTQTHDAGPGDAGYVYFEVEFDPGYLERVLAQRKLLQEGATAVMGIPLTITVMGDALSWRDLNVIAKTARTARDDAFGKPE
jgi:hypothetical protein